jgi:hypothetical protein
MDFGKSPADAKNKPHLADLVKVLLVLIFAVMACLTILTHIAQIIGLPFYLYCIIGLFVSITAVAAMLLNEPLKKHFLLVKTNKSACMVLVLCSVISGSFSAILYRPDLDDIYYVPNVVYCLENPREPMGFVIHSLDSENEPFISYHWGNSNPFEYSQGIVAYFIKTHFLTVYYFLAPVLFGGMIPLVWFYAISRFSFSNHSAIVGTIIVCLSLTLLGEKHASFGNLAFNRIFQGKAVMFAVGLVLFAAFTIDFFRSASVKKWLVLFLIATSMIGLSTSSAMLMPFIVFVLALACGFSYMKSLIPRLRTTLLYCCSIIYPVLFVGSVFLVSLNRKSINVPSAKYFPADFLGQAEYVFGPATVLTLVASSILAVIFIQKYDRYFLMVWILLLVIFFLNPLAVRLLIKHVIPQIIYWRLFYLYPFPLTLGLCGAGAASWIGKKLPKLNLVFAGLVISSLLAAHLPASSPSIFKARKACSHTTINISDYKVTDLEFAHKVLALEPPRGTMLAPATVCHSLPMLTSKYPQIRLRTEGIMLWMDQQGKRKQALHRITASNFLGGKLTNFSLDSLIVTLDNCPQIRSVIAVRRIAELQNSLLFQLMDEYGFTEHRMDPDIVVFIRP